MHTRRMTQTLQKSGPYGNTVAVYSDATFTYVTSSSNERGKLGNIHGDFMGGTLTTPEKLVPRNFNPRANQ